MLEALAILAALGAFAGPLGAYLVAARRFSGKVKTTEATSLWKEARAIREWTSRELDKAIKRAEACEERERELRVRVRALEDQVAAS